MKKIILFIALISSTAALKAQNVSIPDGNLKAALVNNSAINTNGDTEIQVTEAQAYNGSLQLGNLNISNTTGLSSFTNVDLINLQENNITNLTFSVANNSVETLILLMNPLNYLDLSGLNALEYLDIGYCGLNNYNPGNVPSLETFFAPNNDFTSVDFTNSPNMRFITLGSNSNLTSINLSTPISSLHTVRIDYCNSFTGSLDLSNQPGISNVYVNNSPISGLYMASGGNTNIFNFNSAATPNLDCIEVDDVAYSTANWTNISANNSFSVDCDALPPSDTIYVNINATGNNDGTSWTDAYLDARDAFINANDRDQVWIAQGTYIRNSTNRNIVFGWTVDSLKVYGGFSGNGTETSITDRDWDAYPTIFSGDIGVVGDSTDNAYTVFMGPIGNFTGAGEVIDYTLIDGIKITGGNANESNYPQYNTCGGGLAILDNVNNYVIRNVEIYDNRADHGGALYYNNITNLNLTLENCIIRNNAGGTAPGFELRNAGGNINVNMTNCLFYNNEADESTATGNDYGALGFLGADAGLFNFIGVNNTFADNTALAGDESKGAIRAYKSNGSGSFTMINSIFYNNASEYSITDLNSLNAQNQWNNYTILNNILQNGTNISTSGTSNITSDPLFVNATNANYSLALTSPAIDAGTQMNIIPLAIDLAGNPRIYGSEIDLGAYENQGSGGNNGVGIEEENSTALILYPNPTTGIVNIKMNEAIKNVTVYNQVGKSVANHTTNSFSIDQLPAGIYYVKVESSQSQITQKIIKK